MCQRASELKPKNHRVLLLGLTTVWKPTQPQFPQEVNEKCMLEDFFLNVFAFQCIIMSADTLGGFN